MTSCAATPVSVAEAAAESIEVVSSKKTGETDDNFTVVATRKAKAGLPGVDGDFGTDITLTGADAKGIALGALTAISKKGKRGSPQGLPRFFCAPAGGAFPQKV